MINIKEKVSFSIPKIHTNYNYMRVNSGVLGRKRESRALADTALVISLLIITIATLFKGIDRHIENQDIMLCESAKVSGNMEYLEKCECYYEGGDIKCLQK